MTCDYCKTDHEAQNCPNCGAPRTSKAGHGAYRIPTDLQKLIERLPIHRQIDEAAYQREMEYWCAVANSLDSAVKQ